MSMRAKRPLDLNPPAVPDPRTEDRCKAEGGEPSSRRFVVRPKALLAHPGLDFDDVEGLLEYLEGPRRP